MSIQISYRTDVPQDRCVARRFNAFTLIELLVVISIIGLLVAILLPALQKARVSSQMVSSLSNIRQISIALHGYTVDNNGSMPFVLEPQIGATRPRYYPNWARRIHEMNYVSTIEVYWSPARLTYGGAFPHSDRITETNVNTLTGHTYESVGYGLTGAVGAIDGRFDFTGSQEAARLAAYAAKPVYPLNVTHAQTPPHGKMLMLVETYATNTVGGLNGDYYAQPGSSTTANRLFNYNGGVVRSYADGRANAITPSAASVTGASIHINSGASSPVHENELGWNVNAIPSTDIRPGHFSGDWSYRASTDDFDHHEPWYDDWQRWQDPGAPVAWYKTYR